MVLYMSYHDQLEIGNTDVVGCSVFEVFLSVLSKPVSEYTQWSYSETSLGAKHCLKKHLNYQQL